MFCSAPRSASALRGKTRNDLGASRSANPLVTRAAAAVHSGDVLLYTFVTTDENGNQVVVAEGEYEPGEDPYDVGDKVTLQGDDGAENAWKIVRTAPTAYAGVTFFVEPAE